MNLNSSLRKGRCLSPKAILLHFLLASCCMLMGMSGVFAQTRPVTVNLAMLDGQELTPDNLFNFSIQSPYSTTMQATIKGKLVYRASGLSFTYTFPYTLRPGMNLIETATVHAQWTYSSTSFRELFSDYKKLPTGTYEYCVEADPFIPGGEHISGGDGSDCLYQKSNDIFLINLVDPENNAKLHEDFPVLSWMVNYPFVSALTYRVRVAEIKEGQNNTAAINRNNPWYQESNLTGLSVSYPVYAKPLEKFQPYAWTVDAYYKGILLGGAEPWRFTIIDDSLMNGIPKDVSYLDIRQESGNSQAFAIGKLKMKYVLDELKTDTLKLSLRLGTQSIRMRTEILTARQGDNRFDIDFKEANPLAHLKRYTLEISSQTGKKYTVQFQYVNPDFL